MQKFANVQYIFIAKNFAFILQSHDLRSNDTLDRADPCSTAYKLGK